MNATRRDLRLTVLDSSLAVCKLGAAAEPSPTPPPGFFSVTRAADEVSVVCQEKDVPEGARCEKGWRVLKLEGPFEFSEVGVLASVAPPLAEAGVSIFAVSTFDTDYVLVKEEQLEGAIAVLREAGHKVWEDSPGAAVRTATSDDEPFLWEMLYEAVHWGPEEQEPKPPPEELLARPDVRRDLAGWGRDGDFAVVAFDVRSGQSIGAAWYRLFPANERDYGRADETTPDIIIAVDPSRRGAGVGGILLDALMDTALSQGFDAIRLCVESSNRAAIRLYESHGFVEVSEEDGSQVMKAELSATTNDAPVA